MPAKKRVKKPGKSQRKQVAAPLPPPPFPWKRLAAFTFIFFLGIALGIGIGMEQGWVQGYSSQHSENQSWQVKELGDGTIVKHGSFVEYYPGGKTLKEAGEYFMNQKHGQWSEYYPSGKLKRQGTYINGVAQSDWKQWDENGVETPKIQP